jgi:hypothetical protein
MHPWLQYLLQLGKNTAWMLGWGNKLFAGIAKLSVVIAISAVLSGIDPLLIWTPIACWLFFSIGWAIGKTPRFRIVLADSFTQGEDNFYRLPVWNDGVGTVEALVHVDQIIDQNGRQIFDELPSPVHWSHYDKTEYLPLTRNPKLAGCLLYDGTMHHFEDLGMCRVLKVPKFHDRFIHGQIPDTGHPDAKIRMLVRVEEKNGYQIEQWYELNWNTRDQTFRKIDSPNKSAVVSQP